MPEVMSIEVDEEFDPRPPVQPFGLRGPDGNLNIGLILGIGAAVILVIALIVVLANPFASDKPAVKAEKFVPTDPLKGLAVIPLYSPSDKIVQDLQTALNAWATFYNSGDLRKIQNSFDVAGNQYALLQNGSPATATKAAVPSAAEIAANPDTGLPAKVELGNVGNVGKQGSVYTVRAEVTWTKPGTTPINYKWDIEMKKDTNDESYLLSTIKTTDSGALNTLTFCDAVNVVYKLQDTEEVNKKLEMVAPADSIEAIKSVFAIRLKVWKYVQPAFDKSDAPDSVKRIITQYEDSIEILEKDETLDEMKAELGKLNAEASLKTAHSAVEEAASSECNTDISLR